MRYSHQTKRVLISLLNRFVQITRRYCVVRCLRGSISIRILSMPEKPLLKLRHLKTFTKGKAYSLHICSSLFPKDGMVPCSGPRMHACIVGQKSELSREYQWNFGVSFLGKNRAKYIFMPECTEAFCSGGYFHASNKQTKPSFSQGFFTSDHTYAFNHTKTKPFSRQIAIGREQIKYSHLLLENCTALRGPFLAPLYWLS